MKLYRWTKRGFHNNGIVEAGQEVLCDDSVVPSAHMIDVAAESQARLDALDYEMIHAQQHELPPMPLPHIADPNWVMPTIAPVVSAPLPSPVMQFISVPALPADPPAEPVAEQEAPPVPEMQPVEAPVPLAVEQAPAGG